jgi:hypothetical protein
MAMLVVDSAFLRIREDLASLLRLFEEFLRILVVGIAVGVMLHGEAAICLLDLRLGGRLGYVEYLVVIALGHALNQLPKTAGPAGPWGSRRSGLSL